MDSTCVLIGLQVYFHSDMKHENGVSNVAGCLHVVRIYSFMKEIKVYTHASYIVSLFVKTENNNFIKEIKHALRALIMSPFSKSPKRWPRGFLQLRSQLI